ncbi:MAG: hypothetical protein IVW53_14080 [Chloroflexi bacterium]|nr:hypothetical protein [Chloroflexota bacterium]
MTEDEGTLTRMAPGSTPRSGRAAPPPDRRTLARWRRWYARTLRTSRTSSAEEILLGWLVRMPPNVWCLGSPPSAADEERWPGRYLLTPDAWWGPHELAAAQLEALRAQYARFPTMASWDAIPPSAIIGAPGFAFGTPPSSVAPCAALTALPRLRRAWAHRSSDRSGDPAASEAVRHAIGLLRGSLAHVWLPAGPRPWTEQERAAWAAETGADPALWTGRARRSSVQRAPLAATLLRRGLVEAGHSHRAAIRAWLIWEGELCGPALRNPGVREAWRQLRGRPPRGDVGLDDALDSWRDADRRYWEVMGISR